MKLLRLLVVSVLIGFTAFNSLAQAPVAVTVPVVSTNKPTKHCLWEVKGKTNTVFLLVSTDAEQLLATILSRAQLTKVPALRPTEVAAAIRERFPELGEEDAMGIALRSEGDLLEAVEMANKGEEELFIFFRDWLRACFRREVVAAVEFGEGFQKLGRERQKSLVRYGLYLIRQCVMQWQQVPELVRVLGQEQEFVQNFSKLLNERNADGIRRELEAAHGHIERNANPKVLFMDMSYRMMGLLRK